MRLEHHGLLVCLGRDEEINKINPATSNTSASDNPNMLQDALSHGADIDARDSATGQTPLMQAVLSGKDRMVSALLHSGADATLPEKDGYTPMHGACFQGRPSIARILIAHGCDPRSPHPDGYEPAFRATWGKLPRHAATVMVMVEAGGVPLDATDGKGETLQEAIGRNEHARRMLETHQMGAEL